MDNLIYLANILLGVIGFLVALKILREKKKQAPMVCPLNMRCEMVLNSTYSKFLGIPLENLGMLYYGIMILSYSIFLFYPSLRNPLFLFSVFLMTVAGFLFSAYLISVQIFKLREWCSWCLMSAAASITIFVLTLQTNAIINILNNIASGYEISIAIIYALAASIGLGIAVTAEVLFHSFLDDERISEEERAILNILHQATWLTLGIMIVSNYLLFMIDPLLLSSSSNFLIKILILIFLIIINLVYDLFVSSRLIEIFSNADRPLLKIRYLRTLSYILGPISIISWIAFLVLELTTKL